jgi:hypothetical protein
MGGHENCAAMVGQAPEELHEPSLEDHVETARRLVEEQHRWAADQF